MMDANKRNHATFSKVFMISPLILQAHLPHEVEFYYGIVLGRCCLQTNYIFCYALDPLLQRLRPVACAVNPRLELFL